jgi:hypothetical protein
VVTQSLDCRFDQAEQAVAALAAVPVVTTATPDWCIAGAGAECGNAIQGCFPGRQTGGCKAIAHPAGDGIDAVVVGEGGGIASLHRHVGDGAAQAPGQRAAQLCGHWAVRQEPHRSLGKMRGQRRRDGNSFGVRGQVESIPEPGGRMHQKTRCHAELRQGAAQESRIHLAAAEVRLQVDLDQLHAERGAGFIAAISTPQMKANRPSRQPEKCPSSRQRNR